MSFFFGGGARRNDPIKLVDPRPLPRYTSQEERTGDAGCDGYTVLSQSRPTGQGNPPPVAGVEGPSYRGPSFDFEQ